MKKTVFTIISLSLILTLSTFSFGCAQGSEEKTEIDNNTNLELSFEENDGENLTDSAQDDNENLTDDNIDNTNDNDGNEQPPKPQGDQQKQETQENQEKTEEQSEQTPHNSQEEQEEQDGKEEDNQQGQKDEREEKKEQEKDEQEQQKPLEEQEEKPTPHVHSYDASNTCVGCLEKLDYTQNLAYGYDEYYCAMKNEQELYVDQDIIIPYYNDQTLITKIGVSAFEHTMIKSVKLYDNITQIGCYAFYDCVNLQTVYIPKSVTIIEFYAFSNCDKEKLNVQFEDTKGWAIYDSLGDKIEDVPQKVFEDRETLANFLIELGSYNLVKG